MYFYSVDKDYINYLKSEEKKIRKFTRVPDVIYAQNRKFVFGIVLHINNCKYYVGVSHFTDKQEANILIEIPEDKNAIKGSLRFNYMIPVPDDCLRVIEISKVEDIKYRRLMNKEYRFCVDHIDDIKKKAREIYDKVISKTDSKLCYNSCDFILLENAYKLYNIKQEAAISDE